MPTTTSWRPHRFTRLQSLSFVGLLAATVIYFGILDILDGRSEAYFQGLRSSNPDLYLTLLRERRGFDAYLADYRTMEGFDSYKTDVPTFLVGRWTMRKEPIRMIPGTAPAECSDAVTFDFGLLQFRDAKGVSLPVSYEISGESVLLHNQEFGTVPVKLISYGSELDHIEFVPPGQKDAVYAYRCGL